MLAGDRWRYEVNLLGVKQLEECRDHTSAVPLCPVQGLDESCGRASGTRTFSISRLGTCPPADEVANTHHFQGLERAPPDRAIQTSVFPRLHRALYIVV